MSELADSILRMVHAFDPEDSRRDEVRNISIAVETLEAKFERLKASEAAASQEDFNRRNEMDEMGDEVINLFRENAALKNREEMWEEIARNLEERLGNTQRALTAANEDAVYWFRKHRNLRYNMAALISDDVKAELSDNE